MSYPTNVGAPGADVSDWESSFSQILNRTKHNLNRINQKYAPTSNDNILAPRNSVNNENITNSSSLLLEKFNSTNTFLNQPRILSSSIDGALSKTGANQNNNARDTQINDRLTRLEEQQRANESAANARLSSIEKSVEAILRAVDRSALETKEVSHNVMNLQSKYSTVNGLVELLQHENDSKRGIVSKMDSWIRQVCLD
jgi:hypothetical protein